MVFDLSRDGIQVLQEDAAMMLLRIPVALFASHVLLKTCESALREGYVLSGSPVAVLLVAGVLLLLGFEQRRVERSRRLYSERVVQ